MKIGFILVVIVILLLYAALSFYIGYNGWVWLKRSFFFKKKKTYTFIIILLSLSIFVSVFSTWVPLILIGYYWLILVGYSLILLPLANILYFLIRKKGIRWIGSSVLSIYLFIFIFGTYNAWNPIVRNYSIAIDKNIEREELNILLVSDFHLGSIVGKNHLQRFVDIVDETKPDIILIPGDLINDNIEPFKKENMADIMKKIKAPLGVYASLGNHDYYGNDDEEIVKTMEKLGIKVLTDESIMIEDEFFIIGRNDPTDENRKKMSTLVSGLDKTKPLMMLDHQPTELGIAEDNGVDLILSGHTHRGQVAPANLITNMLFENDWGYLKKGKLHSFVSSGFGTWGPPLRIGSQAEVMMIHVTFE
ncbi:metallophosphoesterase [Ferdinandcohnia quinoae]|uniref:Metallophosphoesterase n=1 Tax=Fredinandcohnia quinoae TaxID=2918902 RepID=A0AAW5E040_9BACI|nr:metallophosphoesterase [Fredinandcohnia sp. SECRCQ15]MCH1624049.1 metallophosphoesterase [Fredinandcohnia sp. SECRCQ15]